MSELEQGVRLDVFERDGFACVTCDAVGGNLGDAELHAHHRVPKSEGGTDDLENLVTLCSECHANLHEDPLISRTYQFDIYEIFKFIKSFRRPFVTTTDVSEDIGCTTETARVKLDQLVELGAVRRKKVGHSGVVWWVSEWEENDR